MSHKVSGNQLGKGIREGVEHLAPVARQLLLPGPERPQQSRPHVAEHIPLLLHPSHGQRCFS